MHKAAHWQNLMARRLVQSGAVIFASRVARSLRFVARGGIPRPPSARDFDLVLKGRLLRRAVATPRKCGSSPRGSNPGPRADTLATTLPKKGSSSPQESKAPSKGGLGANRYRVLAIAGDGAHLPGQEMIRRPGTGHNHLAILELLGGRAVAVLIFFDRLGVDKVGDIEQHAVGIYLLATDFFLERIEELVHLDR